MLQGKRVCDTPKVTFPAVSNQPSLLHLISFLLRKLPWLVNASAEGI